MGGRYCIMLSVADSISQAAMLPSKQERFADQILSLIGW
jgi:hypothetical protein